MSGFIFTGAAAAARRRAFNLNDSVTGAPISGQTFAAGEVQVGKNTLSSFADVTNIGSIVAGPLGSYEVEFTATEVNTVGQLYLKIEKPGFYTYVEAIAQVVAVDHNDAVRLGLTALPNAAAEAAGGLYTRGSGAGQINQNANGQVDTRTVAMANDVVTAAAIATDAIGSAEISAAGAAKVAGQVWEETRAGHSTAGSFGQGVASVQGNVTGSVASVTGAVGSVTGAVGSVTGNVGGNVVGSVASVTGNVGGNVVGSVASVGANGISAASIAAAAITAAKFATDAVDANALAASAVTEIQSGLGTSANQTTILGRLPAALVGGRMDSSVGAMAADVLTAAATAADFGTEVAVAVDTRLSTTHGAGAWDGGGGGGGITPQQVADAVWDALRADHQDAGSFGAGVLLAADAVNAASISADAGTELALAVDTRLTAQHGAGLWNGSGGGGDPNLVLQALLAPNAVPGSLAHGLLVAIGSLNTNVRLDQFAYTNGRLTGMRKRVFANGVDAAAGTNPIDTSLVVAVNGPDGPTSYQAVQQP